MLVLSHQGHASNIFRFLQMTCALILLMILCPLGRVTGQGENKTQSPAQVLQDLLARHGDNSTITIPQLRALLELLSQGQEKGYGDRSNVAKTPVSTHLRSNSSKVRSKHNNGSLLINLL